MWFVHMATTVGNYLKFDSKRQMHLGQVEIREMGTRKKEEGRRKIRRKMGRMDEADQRR